MKSTIPVRAWRNGNPTGGDAAKAASLGELTSALDGLVAFCSRCVLAVDVDDQVAGRV